MVRLRGVRGLLRADGPYQKVRGRSLLQLRPVQRWREVAERPVPDGELSRGRTTADGFDAAKETVKFPKPASVQLWDFVSEQLYKKSSRNAFEAFAVEEEQEVATATACDRSSV